MKVAVTGAGGFVGSHVVETLSRVDDVEIVAAVRREIASDRLPFGVAQVELDIATAQPGDFDRLGRPDRLVHLAWDGLPNYRSERHVETELPAQLRFLEAMADGGMTSLLIAGTCYEYGLAEGELGEDRETAPVTAYGEAKVALHRRLDELRARVPFDLIWARLFYLWGPRQAPGSLLPQLRAAVERGDRSFAMSQGDQLRDYLPVEEAARLLAALALRGGNAGAVNICLGKPISILALVEQWLEENGRDIALDLGQFPYPDYEPFAFWGATDKLNRLLSDPRQSGTGA